MLESYADTCRCPACLASRTCQFLTDLEIRPKQQPLVFRQACFLDSSNTHAYDAGITVHKWLRSSQRKERRKTKKGTAQSHRVRCGSQIKFQVNLESGVCFTLVPSFPFVVLEQTIQCLGGVRTEGIFRRSGHAGAQAALRHHMQAGDYVLLRKSVHTFRHAEGRGGRGGVGVRSTKGEGIERERNQIVSAYHHMQYVMPHRIVTWP